MNNQKKESPNNTSNTSINASEGKHGVISKDPNQYGKRKKIEIVSPVDKAYLEATYKKMAKKGWLIDRVKGIRQNYRPIEPCDLEFSVVFFQPNRLLEYPDKEKKVTYQQLITDAGWTYVDNNDLYHVFYKAVDEEIPAIYTEPEEEYTVIVDSMKKGEFISFPMLVITMAYLLWTHLSEFSYRDFYKSGGLSVIVFALVILIVVIPYFGSSLIWLICNRKRAKQGRPLVYLSMKRTQWKNRVYYGISMIALLYMVANMISMVVGSSLGLVMMVAFIIPFIVGVGIAYKVKYIESKRRTNILTAIAGLLIAWVITVAIVFMGIGSFASGSINSIGPDTISETIPTLTHKDLGSDIVFEPIILSQGHTLLAPQSIEYRSVNYETEEPYARIEMTYVKTIAPWYADMIVDRIVEEEKEKIQEEKEYIDKYLLTTDMSYLDYVEPLDVKGDGIDSGYIISEFHDKIVLLKGRELCIVKLEEEIDPDLVTKIIKGIGW